MATCLRVRRFGLQLVLALVVLHASVFLAADAPASSVVTVGEALRDDNHDYVPDRVGQLLTVEGVVTAEPIETGSNALTNLQDESGGIVLFTRSKKLLFGTIHRGDFVRAQGILGQYKGAEQLTLVRIDRLGTRPVPSPREVLAADLQGERYSGQLVRVVGELRFVAQERSGQRDQFSLRDRSGEIAVYVPERIFQGPRYAERLMAGGRAAVVGVAGQYCDKPPFNTGYRLVVINAADIAFAPVPPYKLIVLAIAVLALVGAGWVVSRRRRRRQREKQFEQADEQRRLLEAVLSQMPAGAIVIDATSRRVLFDNEEGRRLSAGQHEPFERALSRCIAEGRVFTEELEGGNNGTGFALRVSSAPIRDHKGRLFAAIVTFDDITESKRAEAALRSAEKLAATGRMAATIAHEINNPLAAMMNILFLLRTGNHADDQFRKYLDAAQLELNRVVHIVRQTLSLYRNTSTPEQVNVAELLDGLLEAYTGILKQRQLVVHRRDRGRPYVRAFSVELRQIFSNILLNAFDAGRTSIQLRMCESCNWKNPTEKGIRVTVADDGPGIPPEHRCRIFEPFFTTKAEKGTGLGLWVVQGMVHKHSGTVQVRTSSTPGRSGTVISVFIPSLPAASGSRPGMPVRGEAAAAGHAVM